MQLTEHQTVNYKSSNDLTEVNKSTLTLKKSSGFVLGFLRRLCSSGKMEEIESLERERGTLANFKNLIWAVLYNKNENENFHKLKILKKFENGEARDVY